MEDAAALSVLRTHAAVASLLDTPGERPVLDVGAGSGSFSALLQARGYEVLALDIDPVDFVQAGLASAPFRETNLDAGLPVEAESADGAVCIEVLEHLENPLLLIREMARAVATGGFVIVTTPNVLSWVSRLELLIRGHHESFDDEWYHVNGHISPISLTTLQRIGARAGLAVE